MSTEKLPKHIRFGDFIHELNVTQNKISFNDLAESYKSSPKNQKLQVSSKDIYRILGPYTSIRFVDQAKAVIPLAVYLMLFQMFILRQGIADALVITGGLLAVMMGLMLFMEGLKLGLMPFGETIGNILPVKSPLPVVLGIAFLLGIGVTLAEPAIGALQEAGKIVDPEKAPYLWALLNVHTTKLIAVVGVGVGCASVLGTLRFVYNWSLKPMIYCSLIPLLAITAFVALTDEQLVKMIGLAWDCGAVTTGPVTVPLVLSLGIGVASAVGKGDSTLSGFGIVTLASLFPIIGVMCLGLWLSSQVSPSEIISTANALAGTETSTHWSQQTPWVEVILAVRAIVPLVIFLFLVMKVVLREKIKNSFIIGYGIVLAVVGMGIFNFGLTYGLGMLGNQSGSLVPAAFASIDAVADSPLYWYSLGLLIALGFAFFLGFGSTLAEPALNALGMTVQNLTNGAFKKSLLMYSVSFGVAVGISLGVAKLIFALPLAWLLIPGYILLLVLTFFSTEEFVNVAWDSAGVTTGPVTVPLVLAMGLGFANATGSIEGFGILSMASLCPVMSVLITGIVVQYKAKKVEDQRQVEAAA
ncbi:MAG: DUF1538 domain-containing protein [Pseudomonadota bacterium]